MKKYVLITHWAGYWDKMSDPYYTVGYIESPLNVDTIKGIGGNNETIFIKTNKKNEKIESIWEGYVSDIKEYDAKIGFKVNISKRRDDLKNTYNYMDSGWYDYEKVKDELNLQTSIDKPTYPNRGHYMNFFDILQTTTQHKEFEDKTFYLLKSLGINTILKYDDNNAGKADGFFKIGNLSALYDCTLNKNYKEEKKTQIENFAKQLKSGKIEIGNQEKTTHTDTKHIWIITRGEYHLIKTIDEVSVIEIPIEKLIEIYYKRLKDLHTEEELKILLINLAKG